MRNPLRRRWQVVTSTPQGVVTRYGVTVLTPQITHRGKKFWFESSAQQHATMLERLAWRYSSGRWLWDCTVERLP